MKPALYLYSHTDRHPLFLEKWQAVAEAALPLCLEAAKSPDAPLCELEEVEISFVTDESIAIVHGDFMDDPTPTDVITFHHGEIVISLDTAQRQAVEHGEAYERETALYVIHGLLHLAGWEDDEPEKREAMHAVQARVLERCWGE